MSDVFIKGKYIFIWGGLIANAGGMTRAMLKRACIFLQEGADVTILLAARGREQLKAIEHYQQNGYPEITGKNFVLREKWMGDRLADMGEKHCVGLLEELDRLPFKTEGKKRTYWDNGEIRAVEIIGAEEDRREIFYDDTVINGHVQEIYWSGMLSRRTVESEPPDGKKRKTEYFYAENGFCHTRVVNELIHGKWEITGIKTFDERNRSVTDWENNTVLSQYFYSAYVNECEAGEVFVFCDPILDFDPGFPLMIETEHKTIYKICVNHGVGFGGDRNWNSSVNPRIRDNIEKQIVPQVDAFVQLTDEGRRDFQKRLGNRDILFTIPNTIVIPETANDFSQRDLNKIVYIGRFDEKQKQISHLIKAFAQICGKYPAATLHIFGRGDSEAQYRRQIEELQLEGRVIMEPFTNQVNEEYQKAAFSVMCSDFEGFSLSLLESLANGCPEISYDFKYGARDAIEDGVNGFLVKKNDIDALADRMAWMLSHPEKIGEMSKKARESSLKYHEKYYLENWTNMLNTVVRQHPYRTFLKEMEFDLSEIRYLPGTDRLLLRGCLTVVGDVPEKAAGMERIYARWYSVDQNDYEILKPSVKRNGGGKTKGYELFLELPACKGRKISICLEWNNCFIERALNLDKI